MAPLLLILILGAAALAGCGGDDGPTKERFVADANRICREGEAKIADAAKEREGEIARAQSPKEQQRVIADLLEVTAEDYEPYMDRLRDLEPPEGLADGWDRFLGGVQEAFDLIPELADATRDGDRETLSELTTKFSRIAGDTRPFAQDNGLTDCLPDATR